MLGGDAASGADTGDGLPAAAVEGERDPDPLAVVAGDLEAV